MNKNRLSAPLHPIRLCPVNIHVDLVSPFLYLFAHHSSAGVCQDSLLIPRLGNCTWPQPRHQAFCFEILPTFPMSSFIPLPTLAAYIHFYDK